MVLHSFAAHPLLNQIDQIQIQFPFPFGTWAQFITLQTCTFQTLLKRAHTKNRNCNRYFDVDEVTTFYKILFLTCFKDQLFLGL